MGTFFAIIWISLSEVSLVCVCGGEKTYSILVC